MEIIYEDNDIIVCYKPAGVATETGRLGQQDMVSILRNYRAAKGEPPYIGMAHRLDQPVEGLLAFGKTQEAAGGLSRQIADRSFGKYYCAAGQNRGGDLSAEWTTLTDYLLFDRKRNLSVVADRGTPQAKKALLDYRVIGQKDDLVCFDIALHTGRHHQIRLQMAHHGFALVGDSKYGVNSEESAQDKQPVRRQLALCCYRLRFSHPVTQKEMEFSIHPHNEIFELFPNV